MHRRWFVLLLVFVSTACASAKNCTAVGCISQVGVNVRPYVTAHPGVTRIRVCADDVCKAYAPPRFTSVPLTAPTEATERVEVRVVVDGPAGATTVRQEATLKRQQPNGPHCGPVCHSAGFQLTPDGALSAVTG